MITVVKKKMLIVKNNYKFLLGTKNVVILS